MNPSAAALLQSDDAGRVLVAALATADLELESWKVDAVHARPGAETSVGYDVVAGGHRLYMIASTAALTDDECAMADAVRIATDAGDVFVWAHPRDPRLPGLADAAVAESLQKRLALESGGADGSSPSTSVSELVLLVLRPLRRAVLRAEVSTEAGDAGTSRTVFVKVVRPAKALDLLARHRALSLAPAAHDLGDGIVAVEAARGVPMTEALHRPEGLGSLVSARALDDALDTLPHEALTFTRRPAVSERLAQYGAAAVARGIDADRISRLEARVADMLDASPDEGATHGDFHPANIYVDSTEAPQTVLSVIDVDTLGPGTRADDYATMMAHLVTLPLLDAVGYQVVSDQLSQLWAAWGAAGGADLRARIAANLVALVSSFESADDAEFLVDEAERVATVEEPWPRS